MNKKEEKKHCKLLIVALDLFNVSLHQKSKSKHSISNIYVNFTGIFFDFNGDSSLPHHDVVSVKAKCIDMI